MLLIYILMGARRQVLVPSSASNLLCGSGHITAHSGGVWEEGLRGAAPLTILVRLGVQRPLVLLCHLEVTSSMGGCLEKEEGSRGQIS